MAREQDLLERLDQAISSSRRQPVSWRRLRGREVSAVMLAENHRRGGRGGAGGQRTCSLLRAHDGGLVFLGALELGAGHLLDLFSTAKEPRERVFTASDLR